MNSTPSPETVIRRAIEVMLRQITTNEPGVIESYDANTCTASVQPLLMVQRRTETGPVTVRQAVVENAPVIFLGGGNFRLTFPVKRGDECLLTVASRSLDRWSAFGGEVDPKSDRRHHITDAFVWVTPHLSPAHVAPAHATAAVFEGDDVRLGDASAAFLALQSDAQGFFDIFNAWSPAGSLGDGPALKLLFTNYVIAHPGWPVGTTKVKAK